MQQLEDLTVEQRRTMEKILRSMQDEYRSKKKDMERQRREMEAAGREMARKQREMERQMKYQEQRIKQQEKLFQMKFALLEEELKKAAKERQEFAAKKAFYNKVMEYDDAYSRTGTYEDSYEEQEDVSAGFVFFKEMTEPGLIRKRYRELLKLFHPDNAGGDTGMLQQINEEYEQLRQQLEGMD